MLSTNRTTGTVVVGSSLTLSCTVDLPMSVDVPVTVMVVWSNQVNNTPPVTMENITRYISTVNLTNAVVGSETYSCTAKIISDSPNLSNSEMVNGSLTVVVGKLLVVKLGSQYNTRPCNALHHSC